MGFLLKKKEKKEEKESIIGLSFSLKFLISPFKFSLCYTMLFANWSKSGHIYIESQVLDFLASKVTYRYN